MLRFLVLAMLLFLSPASFASPQRDEAAVWKLEEAYWQYVKDNNVKRFQVLWDERFVGWPGFSDSPVAKAGVSSWILPLHSNPVQRYDYELTQKATKSFGDVVVVHYLVRAFYRDAKSDKVLKELGTSRITHTWQRRGKTWQIITGMSNAHVVE